MHRCGKEDEGTRTANRRMGGDGMTARVVRRARWKTYNLLAYLAQLRLFTFSNKPI